MCRAISDFYSETGIKVGFKAAGGITTTADALTYYQIVNSYLGEEWHSNTLFRIGASRLANNILADISGTQNDYF
jgi:deoxyribose-phosphate aldolase